MIFIHKHYTALLFGYMVIVAAVYISLINIIPGFRANVFLNYLYFFAVIPVFFITVSHYMKTVSNRINDILLNGCDPAPYISIYEDIISHIAKMERPSNMTYFRINLSTGLTAAGKNNEAYEVLKKCSISSNSRRGKLNSAVYYNNLLLVCLKLGLIDEAKTCLDSMTQSLAMLKPADYKKYEWHITRAQYSFNFAQGVYDNTENIFAEAFDASNNNYQRVASKSALAKIYLHYGDAARAKEALEYVINHGNKLYIVEEAKEGLAQLG